jgi:thioredoxin 1
MDSPKTFQDLIAGDKPVLVDFFAEWCGPCRMMPPILNELKGLVCDRVTVIKVDVDRNPGAAQAYNVRGVPTLIIFKNGQPVWRRSGVMNAAQLQEAIAPHLHGA